MSELLDVNGKHEEGFPYAKSVYEKQGKAAKGFAQQIKTTYVNCLLQLDDTKKLSP